jgi:hypothetical protein
MRGFTSLPAWLAPVAGVLFAAAGLAGIVFAVTGAIPIMAAWAMVVFGTPTAIVLIGVATRSMTRTADRHFAECAVRGIARVRDYEPVGRLARGKGTGQLRLEIDLEVPGRVTSTHRYWTLVDAVDLPRLTTVGRFPCLVTTDDPPHVRLYVRRDVDDDTLGDHHLGLVPLQTKTRAAADPDGHHITGPGRGP